MNEETSTPEPQASPESASPSVSEPPANPPKSGRGLPSWLPYIALAIIPAVVVGALVFVLAGGSTGSSGYAPGIVEGLLRLTPDSNTQVDSYKGELPPNLPAEIPLYVGADPVVSFAIVTPGGTNFFIVLTSDDPADDVFAFFRDELDKDPWQVEIGQSSSDVTGIQFSRPDNADVSGVITVHRSKLDDITSILITYEDISAALTPGTGAVVPQLSQSRQIPPDFPEEIPIYAGASETIVLDTYFQRGQGGRLFAVTFLTLDSQDDVIDFYTDQFTDLDWTVTTSTSTATTSFAIGIEFSDLDDRLQGEVTADVYEDDTDYTRVDVIVQVSAGSRGN